MKARVTFLVGSLLQILGCDGQDTWQAREPCATESKAILTATDLLSKQSQVGEFQADKARALNSGDKWSVSIPRVTKPGIVVLPDGAIVEVNKANCASRWVPQR